MADLTAKQQPRMWAISLAGMAAAGTGLTGVIGIDLDTEQPSKSRLVGEMGIQLSKSPLGGVPIGFPLLLRGPLALLPFGALPDVGQVFQADQCVGMGVQNMLSNGMIGIQLQPSLSPADSDPPPFCRASAFLLKPLLEAGIVICFGAYFLSRIELRPVPKRGNGDKVALAHIHTKNLALVTGLGIRRLDGQTHQQIEALPGLVIPEFGPADDGPMLQQGHMPVVALVRHMDTASQREEAHLLAGSEGVVVSIDVGQRGRDVLGSVIQTFEATLGVAEPSGFGILAGTSPQRLVRGSNLPKDAARQLGRQGKLTAYLLVQVTVQLLAVARLAVSEGLDTRQIQRVPIGQLGLPQRLKLLGRGSQFKFGGQGCFHLLYCTIKDIRQAKDGSASSHT